MSLFIGWSRRYQTEMQKIIMFPWTFFSCLTFATIRVILQSAVFSSLNHPSTFFTRQFLKSTASFPEDTIRREVVWHSTCNIVYVEPIEVIHDRKCTINRVFIEIFNFENLTIDVQWNRLRYWLMLLLKQQNYINGNGIVSIYFIYSIFYDFIKIMRLV